MKINQNSLFSLKNTMGDFGDTMFWIFIIVDRDMGRVLSSTMVDRNILLQDMKKTLGRGGTLFVCLFVCLYVCLFVCLFVCYLVS